MLPCHLRMAHSPRLFLNAKWSCRALAAAIGGSTMSTTASTRLRVVSASQFDRATQQTPGSGRLAAIFEGHDFKPSMWGGLFTIDPGFSTAIHHHGEQDTIAYVLQGQCLLRWGERGEFSATARAGDFLFVPGRLPHMEINRSLTQPCRWVVVRSTPTPIVVNLPEDYWDRARVNPPAAHSPA
jgi:uncharacterized RmlC-like cupin family protein